MIVRDQLTVIFQRFFEIEGLALQDAMTAKDVPGWDSLAHIGLIMEIEEHFKLRFSVDDIADLKNVGEMIELLERKVARA